MGVPTLVVVTIVPETLHITGSSRIREVKRTAEKFEEG